MNGPGRPTLYRPEYAREARNYCLLGATNDDLAAFFEVAPRTLDGWLATHPAFAEAVREGRMVADAEVVQSLYRRALGYDYETRRTVLHRGETYTLPATIHRPADVRACMFWLRNRRPKQWREGARPAPEGWEVGDGA